MSKLSQLKQKAYQAGKNRNWDEAITVYEKILELEKNNPTIINELGDLCLKGGETSRAVKHFLSAASKYRKTGLLNNSVAIYKKVLRHEDENPHAHWYLAETRASQGLTVEGADHAVRFLEASSKVNGDLKEIFLKRCIKMFELYPTNAMILERLVQTFRMWEKTLEEGRANCLLACTFYDAGDEAAGAKLVADTLTKAPELTSYFEYNQWLKRVDPTACAPEPTSDYNSVSLADSAPASEGGAEVESPGFASSNEIEIPEVASDPVADTGDVVDETPAPLNVGKRPDALELEKDGDGCISIDTDDTGGLEDLIAEAAGALKDEGLAEEVLNDPETIAIDDAPVEQVAEPKVDLLAQILAEDSGVDQNHDSDQLATITSEIGNIVGGEDDGDDAGRLYEMGMVYLEMGMFDQACESFEIAAAEDEFSVRAHEMWGITLQRANRPDDAVKVLTSGLDFADQDSREELGLRYHIARAHEMATRSDAAAEIYEKIHQVAPGFLDVGKRLNQLSGV